MKKILFLLALVATCIVSCNSDDPIVNIVPGSELNIIDLRNAGKELPGVSYDASNCKPDGSEQTLKSVRYVGELPIYFMDYYAKVDWDKLEKDSAERYAPADATPVVLEFNNMLYKNTQCLIRMFQLPKAHARALSASTRRTNYSSVVTMMVI